MSDENDRESFIAEQIEQAREDERRDYESADHDLKTWPPYFEAVFDGRKQFEIRRTDDRTFRVGDVLLLREWLPISEQYTGRWCTRLVTYILSGALCPDGFAVMSIQPVTKESRAMLEAR